MDALQAIVLGVVEGVTEFLPISSTGHLILASSLMQLEQSEFLKTFEIFIQLGAILAVVVVFWKKLLDVELLKKIIVAFIPTGIIGLTLYKLVKSYLLGNEAVVLWSLFLGGIALIAFEYLYPSQASPVASESADSRELARISYTKALAVGLFQAVAIIPGVSRSGATIVGGMLLGLRRRTIVEFSFLLAIPTMLAASGLDLLKSASSISANEVGALAIGFSTAFIVALISIVWLLRFVRTHTFVPFGVYRILVALLFWVIILR